MKQIVVIIWCNKGSFRQEGKKERKLRRGERRKRRDKERKRERIKAVGSEMKEDMEAGKFPWTEKLAITKIVLFFY